MKKMKKRCLIILSLVIVLMASTVSLVNAASSLGDLNSDGYINSTMGVHAQKQHQ